MGYLSQPPQQENFKSMQALIHQYLALIPGRTEDGPGIDCLRIRHIITRKWGLRIASYMPSKTMTSQRTEVD